MATKVRSKVTIDGELAFPSDYISSVELKGRDVTVTIAAVSNEPLQMMGGGTKKKLVLRFNRTPKKLVCNRTNADTIAVLYGTKAEGWVGKTITLYPTRCLAFGEMVDCIRIRERKQNGVQPPREAPDRITEPDAFGEESNAVADALDNFNEGNEPPEDPRHDEGGQQDQGRASSPAPAPEATPTPPAAAARSFPPVKSYDELYALVCELAQLRGIAPSVVDAACKRFRKENSPVTAKALADAATAARDGTGYFALLKPREPAAV